MLLGVKISVSVIWFSCFFQIRFFLQLETFSTLWEKNINVINFYEISKWTKNYFLLYFGKFQYKYQYFLETFVSLWIVIFWQYIKNQVLLITFVSFVWYGYFLEFRWYKPDVESFCPSHLDCFCITSWKCRISNLILLKLPGKYKNYCNKDEFCALFLISYFFTFMSFINSNWKSFLARKKSQVTNWLIARGNTGQNTWVKFHFSLSSTVCNVWLTFFSLVSVI